MTKKILAERFRKNQTKIRQNSPSIINKFIGEKQDEKNGWAKLLACEINARLTNPECKLRVLHAGALHSGEILKSV